MAVLDVKNLKVTYQNLSVIEDFSFQVASNEFVAIIAPSGAGKTTVLKALAGLIDHQAGSIKVDDQLVTGLNTNFSYMPQDSLLFEWQTVYQNVVLEKKLKNEQIDKKGVNKLLKLFQLDDFSEYYPDQLSGGMAQRVALLRAVMSNSEILLLDEPFGALDPLTRQGLQKWMMTIKSDLKKSMLLITHDILEAIYLADRVIVCGNKPLQILKIYDTHEIITQEWSEYTQKIQEEIYQLLVRAKNVN